MDGLIWLLGLVVMLLLLQRLLHREIQAVFLLLFRQLSASLALFSIVFLPGVFLHELSHFIVAKLLLVRTGRFSLTPRPMANGRLQMGFVETGRGGVIREALIGAAPLISGGALVAYVGLVQLNLAPLGEHLLQGNLGSFWSELIGLGAQNDFWIWFYLVFVVSSTMFPSDSDRQAWLPLILVSGLIVGLALLAGAGPWLVLHLAPMVNQALRTVVAIFAISLATHIVLLLPVWGIRVLLSRITGLEVT